MPSPDDSHPDITYRADVEICPTLSHHGLFCAASSPRSFPPHLLPPQPPLTQTNEKIRRRRSAGSPLDQDGTQTPDRRGCCPVPAPPGSADADFVWARNCNARTAVPRRRGRHPVERRKMGPPYAVLVLGPPLKVLGRPPNNAGPPLPLMPSSSRFVRILLAST